MILMLISSKIYTTQSQQLLLTSKSQPLNKMKYIAQAPELTLKIIISFYSKIISSITIITTISQQKLAQLKKYLFNMMMLTINRPTSISCLTQTIKILKLTNGLIKIGQLFIEGIIYIVTYKAQIFLFRYPRVYDVQILYKHFL